MEQHLYILVGTENNNATFLLKDSKIMFFEIFQLDNKVIAFEQSNNKVVVEALNQQEALKKFRQYYPNLVKRSTKDYYEAVLIV